MKKTKLVKLVFHSVDTFLFHRNRPVFGTLILTDRCNLSCKHCKLNSYTNKRYSYKQVYSDMETLYQKGVRVLCFSGGEIALWEDQEHTIKKLVGRAKEIGFLYVAIATNGTIPFDYGDADYVLISIDGSRDSHNQIRGNTYDTIINNIRNSKSDKVSIFMTINKFNQYYIREACELARREEHINVISFNFHTPFKGTKYLALSKSEKEKRCNEIARYMDVGYPILNLRTAFPYLIQNSFPKPCKQMIVMENGEEILCNRCIKEGLCNQCGYFEAAEIALLFHGNIKVTFDGIFTYGKYIF